MLILPSNDDYVFKISNLVHRATGRIAPRCIYGDSSAMGVFMVSCVIRVDALQFSIIVAWFSDTRFIRSYKCANMTYSQEHHQCMGWVVCQIWSVGACMSACMSVILTVMREELPDVTEAFVAVVNWVTAVQVVRVALPVWISKQRTCAESPSRVGVFINTVKYSYWYKYYLCASVGKCEVHHNCSKQMKFGIFPVQV